MEQDPNLSKGPKGQKQPKKEAQKQSKPSDTTSEKFPSYIGLFAEGDTSKDVTQLCLEALRLAKAAFPDDAQIEKDIAKITAGSRRDWALTPDPHITTLFLGHKAPGAEQYSSNYSKFTTGTKINFDILAVAYLPGQILTGVTKIDRGLVACDNKFDHMTLMTGTLTAKYSNDLLEQIFVNANYLAEREQSFASVTAGRVERVEVNVQKKKQFAYLVKPLQPNHSKLCWANPSTNYQLCVPKFC